MRSIATDLRSSSFDPVPPRPRVKIGVKMNETARRRELSPPRDCLFMTFVDDLRHARREYQSGLGFCEREIERLEAGDPEDVLVQVRREQGESATIASAIEREWTHMAECWAMLEEIEDTPAAHEEDLWQVLEDPCLHDDRPLYNESITRFVSAYGDTEPIHVQFLVSRAAMEAEMDLFCGKVLDNWDGTRWRAGDIDPVKLSVDPANLPVDFTLINRGRYPESRIDTSEQMIEHSLYAARKVAAIISFHEREGNETARAYWQHWLDRELSTLSQLFGVNYELDVDESKVPPVRTIRRWESEVNVLDSEDQAKLRHWEAVAHYWYLEGEDDSDPEEASWAEYVEGEAEETRQWAEEKRERLVRFREHEIRRRQSRRRTMQRRRFGARARQSHGRSSRCRGSRRAASRSGAGKGGDPPDGGDPDEPASARRRRGVRGALLLVLLLVFSGCGAVTTESPQPTKRERFAALLEGVGLPRYQPEEIASLYEDRLLRSCGAGSEQRELHAQGFKDLLSIGREIREFGRDWPAQTPRCDGRYQPSFDRSSAMYEAMTPEQVDELIALLPAILGVIQKQGEGRRMEKGSVLMRAMMEARPTSGVHRPLRVRQRGCRQSRGGSVRRRGSRRIASRSAGGGSSGDDDDGGGEPKRADARCGALEGVAV